MDTKARGLSLGGFSQPFTCIHLIPWQKVLMNDHFSLSSCHPILTPHEDSALPLSLISCQWPTSPCLSPGHLLTHKRLLSTAVLDADCPPHLHAQELTGGPHQETVLGQSDSSRVHTKVQLHPSPKTIPEHNLGGYSREGGWAGRPEPWARVPVLVEPAPFLGLHFPSV